MRSLLSDGRVLSDNVCVGMGEEDAFVVILLYRLFFPVAESLQ